MENNRRFSNENTKHAYDTRLNKKLYGSKNNNSKLKEEDIPKIRIDFI